MGNTCRTLKTLGLLRGEASTCSHHWLLFLANRQSGVDTRKELLLDSTHENVTERIAKGILTLRVSWRP